jgi:catechol 2,3-dioxygenase-like lactoylglutathione lyase family enzyme
MISRANPAGRSGGRVSMQLNHIHVRVRDLSAALSWLDRVWGVKPTFQDERMASLAFEPIVLIVDKSDQETDTIIGFESDDCDRDFHRLVERGAVVDSEPSNKPWGARSAYIKGPGALKFEIESPIK